EGHVLQALVTNLDASPYVGRLALCRVRQGTISRGQQVACCRVDGTIEPAKVSELYVTEALDRVGAEEAGPGGVVAVGWHGELQLAVLVEMMRREGYELTVGKPQVVTRTVDGRLLEPVERVAIDAPQEYLGVISQLFSLRKGRLARMVNHGTGWIRMEYVVPARGLIGFRTEFLTETRGTGQLHHVFEGYEPWHGELRTRPSGSLVADRSGVTTQFALLNLQERGAMFVGPGEEVYEGMIVGENAR